MTTLRPPVVGTGNRTPSADPVVADVTITYDVVKAVAVLWIVPAAATPLVVEYSIPVVSCIVPGAKKVVGVDSVTAPVDGVAVT